jgi:hypothetical protein
MMTERDIEESDLSNGKIENGATLRTCLALRHVMFAHSYNKENIVHPDLRVVLQMTTPSVYVDAACFKGPAGNDVILPMEITMFLNSLMFSCAAQPGLAKVPCTLTYTYTYKWTRIQMLYTLSHSNPDSTTVATT